METLYPSPLFIVLRFGHFCLTDIFLFNSLPNLRPYPY